MGTNLNETVNNTDNDKYWDKPHIGVSIQENLRIVEYEDFFNNRWDGTKVSGNFEIFPNEKKWYRGQLTGGIAYFNQPWHLIISGKLFFSKNLNIVNQKITVLADTVSDNLFLGARNIKNICVIPAISASTYDLLDNNYILADMASVESLNTQLAN